MKRIFSPNTTQVVFFDMNNTLVDPNASFASCFVHVLTDFTGRWVPDDSDGEHSPNRVLDVYLNEWNTKKKRIGNDPKSIAEAKRHCLERALAPYPFQVNDAFVSSFFRAMRDQAREHAALFPQAYETVTELAKHYRIGVITNGTKERQSQVLRRVKLSSVILDRHIFASSSTGSRKPHPGIFKQAIKGMGVSPGNSVMVGDSWKNDITGASACGMNAVWLNRNAEAKKPPRKVGIGEVAVVRSFRQLQTLFL